MRGFCAGAKAANQEALDEIHKLSTEAMEHVGMMQEWMNIQARRNARHKHACVDMTLDEIRSDLQQPRLFNLSKKCPFCDAFRDVSEKVLCCGNGQYIFGTDSSVDGVGLGWDSDYCELLCNTENLGAISRQLNNQCNFSSIGTQRADHKLPAFEYEFDGSRGQKIPRMYAVNGRTYHVMPVLRQQGRVGEQEFYFDHHPDLPDNVSKEVVDKFQRYMTERNGLAEKLRLISDIHFSNDHKRTRESMERMKQMTTQMYLHLHPADEPKSNREAFTVQGTSDTAFNPPRLEGMAMITFAGEEHFDFDNDPLDDADAHDEMNRTGYFRHRNMLRIPAWSHLFEPTQYSLIFPHGIGGFYCMQGPDGVFHRTKMGGTVLTSVAEYVKYMLYQSAPELLMMHTLLQQYILDQFSRWQFLQFQAMKQNPRLVASMKERVKKAVEHQDAAKVRREICLQEAAKHMFEKMGTKPRMYCSAKFKEIRAAGTENREVYSRPFVLPASVPGSPAYQRKEIRNGSHAKAILMCSSPSRPVANGRSSFRLCKISTQPTLRKSSPRTFRMLSPECSGTSCTNFKRTCAAVRSLETKPATSSASSSSRSVACLTRTLPCVSDAHTMTRISL